MLTPFPIIDLFAGPGGLGEGFASLRPERGQGVFSVPLSVEMDPVAHQTLLLRKFFRSFRGPVDDYFDYVAGNLARDELFARHPEKYNTAKLQAWRAELGRTRQSVVTTRIRLALNGARAWALIGGPPCQAYSIVGRSRMQSRTNPEFEKDRRHFLYREYLRIVARHRPPVFLMENVKGLLSATHGGEKILHRILSDLHQPGVALRMRGRRELRYRLFSLARAVEAPISSRAKPIPEPDSLVVRAEEYGVPQARHRVFVLGIREDVEAAPGCLDPTAPVTVASVIEGMPAVRSTLSREEDSAAAWRKAIAEVRHQEWFRSPAGREQSAVAHEAAVALKAIGNVTLGVGAPWLRNSGGPARRVAWYRTRCSGLSNHEARGHMRSDLHRYFFAACFASACGQSPTLEDFPRELLPEHRNAERGRRGEMFGDRFRVQVWDRPAATITSHISKDGHYFIHPDPTQCRSLTVREAARLQTFPDSYHFEGPRTEQYRQVGNAVPPLLAQQIASIVHKVLLRVKGAEP